MSARPLRGAGLGFRRELLAALDTADLSGIQFFEVAPENWIQLGGRFARDLRRYTERYPFVCHGLSLSLGSTDPLDRNLLAHIRQFMSDHQIPLYTEHLSWCSYDGHLYDLLPLPFNRDTARWIAGRVRQVQDFLGQRIGIENSSYYLLPEGSDMSEVDFINEVVRESDCLLHLDVNNLYVNSRNMSYDAEAFLAALPLERVCYLHVAGHYVDTDGWITDTHGAAVIDPVWSLLENTYRHLPQSADQVPTCLERDFNFPAFREIQGELSRIRSLQSGHRPFHDLTANHSQTTNHD